MGVAPGVRQVGMESSAQVEAEGRGQLFFGRRGRKEEDEFEEKMKKFMSDGLCLRGERESELTEIITDQWSSAESGFASQGTVGNVWRRSGLS